MPAVPEKQGTVGGGLQATGELARAPTSQYSCPDPLLPHAYRRATALIVIVTAHTKIKVITDQLRCICTCARILRARGVADTMILAPEVLISECDLATNLRCVPVRLDSAI